MQLSVMKTVFIVAASIFLFGPCWAYTPLTRINGAVQVRVQLELYAMPDDHLFDGSNCAFDIFASETCDLAFNFCVEQSDGPNPTPVNICSGRWYPTGQLTTHVDQQAFNYGKPYGKWYNPMVFTYNYGWSASWFKAQVFNQDGSSQKLIDNFLVSLNSSILNIPSQNFTFLGVKGQRPASPTTLSFRVDFACTFGVAADGKNCVAYRSTTTTTAASTATYRQVLQSNNEIYVLGKLDTSYERQMGSNIKEILLSSGVPLITTLYEDSNVLSGAYNPIVNVTFTYFTIVNSDSHVTQIQFFVTLYGRLVSSVSLDHAFAVFSQNKVRTMLSKGMGLSSTLTIVTRSQVQIEKTKPWYKQYWWVILIVCIIIGLLLLGLLILSLLLCQFRRQKKATSQFYESNYHRTIPTVYTAQSRNSSTQRLWIPEISDRNKKNEGSYYRQETPSNYVYGKAVDPKWEGARNRPSPPPDYQTRAIRLGPEPAGPNNMHELQQSGRQNEGERITEEIVTVPANLKDHTLTMDSQLRRVYQVNDLGVDRRAGDRRSLNTADLLY